MNRQYFPSLRGVFGKWRYYVCLLPLTEVASRVSYADELQQSKNLSEFIQRTLKDQRGLEIAQFLRDRDDRFFNSLVVAVYDGSPNWNEFGNLKPSRKSEVKLDELADSTRYSIGLLSFDGNEKLFALDGQHRLAGIRNVAESEPGNELLDDQVPLIFVAHENSPSGIKRSRRLFTMLNKNAKPVSKEETIALDEDDVMAICVRRLVNRYGIFKGERIEYVTKNLPPANNTSLTTIGNLYDILKILFTKFESDLKRNVDFLTFKRPDEETIELYVEFAKTYFTMLSDAFPQLHEFFTTASTISVVEKYRHKKGGHILFRPIGLIMFTEIIAEMSKKYEIKDCIEYASWLPTNLNVRPYSDVLFTKSGQVILTKNKTICRELLLYMLDELSSTKLATLPEKYGKAVDDIGAGKEMLATLDKL